jgi:hypothetical protein
MALSKIETTSLDIGQLGGRRNLVINGDHKVQQRGTTFSTSGSDRFTSDRWALNPIGASPCSASIQFDATLQKNTLKVTKQTSTGDIQIIHKIEGFKQFHNKQFTLSYYVRASTERDLYIGSGFSSASGFNTIDTTTVPATTQWQKFTRTFSSTDMSSYTENNSSWLRIEFRLSGSSGGSVAAGEWIEFTDVQLELGPTATEFEHRSFGEELALCHRFYVRMTDNTSQSSIAYGRGAGSGQNVVCAAPIPVPMRASPTVTSTGAYHASDGNSRTSFTPTSVVASGFNPYSSNLGLYFAAGTAICDDDRVTLVGGNGATTLEIEAEL